MCVRACVCARACVRVCVNIRHISNRPEEVKLVISLMDMEIMLS